MSRRGKGSGTPPPAEPPSSPPLTDAEYATLTVRWQGAWPAALAAWSSYTQLHEPRLIWDEAELKREAMADGLAAIRLTDQTILINLRRIASAGLTEYAVEFLAHEIGHHVYAPGNLADNARVVHAMEKVLVGLPIEVARRTANLYEDLLINDRLQRSCRLDLAGIYERLKLERPDEPTGSVWQVFMRTFEHLWHCPPGRLTRLPIDDELNGDAALLARLVRHFAGDWLMGARRFASILYRYWLEDQRKNAGCRYVALGLADCRQVCRAGGKDPADIPDGLLTIHDMERGDDGDFDDLFSGETPKSVVRNEPSPHQHREPFEYQAILNALGLDLSGRQVTSRYYRERAMPHLIPFPQRRSPQSVDPLPEGFDAWDAGEDLQQLDLFGSILRSPKLIPGTTTVQQVYGDAPGHEPARVPLDLDIYVDCSGSMPNPSYNTSYLALAGAILTLSALRAGAKVQATLWSGPKQFETSGGFIRDERKLLAIVTGYICGSTAFPLHVLRKTYEARRAHDRPVHLVVISDDGVDTILQNDELGNPGDKLCRLALDKARGGGTLVLNLPDGKWLPQERLEELGFKVHRVAGWDQLIGFARAFVRDNYARP